MCQFSKCFLVEIFAEDNIAVTRSATIRSCMIISVYSRRISQRRRKSDVSWKDKEKSIQRPRLIVFHWSGVSSSLVTAVSHRTLHSRSLLLVSSYWFLLFLLFFLPSCVPLIWRTRKLSPGNVPIKKELIVVLLYTDILRNVCQSSGD